MSYANKRGHAKAFDSGIAGAEFITIIYIIFTRKWVLRLLV